MAVSLVGIGIAVFLGLMIYNIIASIMGERIGLPHITLDALIEKVKELFFE